MEKKTQTFFKLKINLISERFTREHDQSYLKLVEAFCFAFNVTLYEEYSNETIDYDIPDTQLAPYQHFFKLRHEGHLQENVLVINALNAFCLYHKFEMSFKANPYDAPDYY